MSKNSASNSTSLLAAGLIGIGVGVLAAGVVNAIRTSSPSNNPAQGSKRTVRKRTGVSELHKQHSTIKPSQQKEQNESSGCSICGKVLSLEPNITLDCNHSYHKKCIFSSYVVQLQINNAGKFQCPMTNCQALIPEKILESLISLH